MSYSVQVTLVLITTFLIVAACAWLLFFAFKEQWNYRFQNKPIQVVKLDKKWKVLIGFVCIVGVIYAYYLNSILYPKWDAQYILDCEMNNGAIERRFQDFRLHGRNDVLSCVSREGKEIQIKWGTWD